MKKTRTQDPITTIIVKNVARKRGVSPQYVRLVNNGARKNEDILTDSVELHEKIDDVLDNYLVKEVETLVPFEKPTAKTAKKTRKK